MTRDRSLKAHAEVMLKILLLIIEKTPLGGARKHELRAAYHSVKGAEPHDRTLRRIIGDLNDFVATWENEGTTSWAISIPPGVQAKITDDCPPPVAAYRHSGEQYYVFTRDLTSVWPRQLPPELATLALRLYPLHKSIGNRLYEHLLRRLKSDPALRPDRWRQFEENLERHVFVSGLSTKDADRLGTKLRQLFDAVCRRKRVQFTYQGSTAKGPAASREIEPYGLLFRQSVWYVTGRDLTSGQLRLFRLDQLENIRLLENSHYTIPSDFSLSATFGDVWAAWVDDDCEPTNVVLRVHPLVAQKFTHNVYHPSQQEELLTDGWLKVTFRLKGIHQMLPWLMSWGTMVEVLEPKELRTQLANIARKVWQLYGQPD